MPKILGICGSPRKGATEYALNVALDEAKKIPGIEVELWTVRGKKIGPCLHCDACLRGVDKCPVQDDFQEFEEKFLEADGFIMASPVYSMGITAQLTAVMNRLRFTYLARGANLQNKVGAAITTGGTRSGGQETARGIILNYFMMHEMLTTGGLIGCYTGGSIWSKDKKADGAMEDEVGMNTVRRLGRGMAEAVKVSHYGLQMWNKEKGRLGIEDEEGKTLVHDH